jgi:hypothetical protein
MLSAYDIMSVLNYYLNLNARSPPPFVWTCKKKKKKKNLNARLNNVVITICKLKKIKI